VKEGWQTKKLGELCQLISGQHIEAKDYNMESRGVGYLTGPSDFGDVNPIISKWTEHPKIKAQSGDILITVKGSGVGKINLLDQNEVAISRQLMAVRVTSAFPRFVHAFLSSTFDYFQSLSTGAAIPGISREQVLGLEIAAPSIPEQRWIVRILDAFESIATAKANAEKNLQNAHALFESYLQTVFSQGRVGWVNTTIGQQIHFIDYRGKTPVKTECGLRLITAKNVKMGYLQETPQEFIAPTSYDAWMTRGIPRKGDVLFTTEAPLANVAQLDTNEKVAFAQRIIIMQPDETKLDSAFLKYLLLSGPVQQRIRAKGTGATVQGIKASLLKLIEISFPAEVSAQRQFVTKLDALSEETERLEFNYQRKLDALDALKKSLLYQAFTGAL
jgi:type I restriction enzyme S subunit